MSEAWLGQAFEHDADHGEAHECGDGCGVAFEIAGQAAIAADPGEAALDDPSLRQDDETVEIAAPNDLHCPTSCGGDRRRHFRPLVSGVGKDALDERKTPPHLLQQIARPVTVLNVGGQNAHAEQKAERVDKDVALAARDLLARIEALRVERSAPF